MWSRQFDPPAPPKTRRMHFEILGPSVVEFDYEAIMGSRERLRDELHWGDPSWPPDDFRLEDNHIDLAKHQLDFERREAFAYTVLVPDLSSCLGCIYIEKVDDGARLAFWVIDKELDTGFEEHMLRTTMQWIEDAWPLDRILTSIRPENPRGRALIESLDIFREFEGGTADHHNYLWTRP